MYVYLLDGVGDYVGLLILSNGFYFVKGRGEGRVACCVLFILLETKMKMKRRNLLFSHRVVF